MDKGGHHHGVSDDGVSSEEDGGSGESGEEGRGERRRNLRKWAPRKAYVQDKRPTRSLPTRHRRSGALRPPILSTLLNLIDGGPD